MTNATPPPVEKAGAIMINQTGTKVVLVYRGNHHDWSFPKGHLEPGENPLSTMLREITEETGLLGTVISPLPTMTYLNATGAEVHLHMYLLRATTEQLITEHAGDKLAWVNLAAVADTVTHQNLKDYFVQQLPGIRQSLS